MDPRKTGYQYAHVTSVRKGSHFQLRLTLAQPRAKSCENGRSSQKFYTFLTMHRAWPINWSKMSLTSS